MAKKIITTKGKLVLEKELENLKVVTRKEIAQKIKEARAQGDLSENAEYDAAKDEQAEIEAKIAEMEAILKGIQLGTVEVVRDDNIDTSIINIGCKVKVWDFEFEEEEEYFIVGSTEANPLEGKLSNESPVGAELLGSKIGDIVQVKTPAGIVKFKVLDITI